MKRILFIFVLSAHTLCAQDADTLHSTGPLYWGGILVGFTQEREVVKLYGAGLHANKGPGPDCGTRYYTNSTYTLTMVVEFGTDCIVEGLWICRGFVLPPSFSDSAKAKMVSDFFLPYKDKFVFPGLQFGDTTQRVFYVLGSPSSKGTEPTEIDPTIVQKRFNILNFKSKKPEILEYTYNASPDLSGELGSGINIGFVNGRMEYVTLFYHLH
jgi:hypothetical protein